MVITGVGVIVYSGGLAQKIYWGRLSHVINITKAKEKDHHMVVLGQ